MKKFHSLYESLLSNLNNMYAFGVPSTQEVGSDSNMSYDVRIVSFFL
jgi:hypothetical protein